MCSWIFSDVRSSRTLLQHFLNLSPIMEGLQQKERVVMGDEQQAGQYCV